MHQPRHWAVAVFESESSIIPVNTSISPAVGMICADGVIRIIRIDQGIHNMELRPRGTTQGN